MVFLPVEPQQRLLCEGILERISREEGLRVLGWRDTPVNVDAIGRAGPRIAALHRADLHSRAPPA